MDRERTCPLCLDGFRPDAPNQICSLCEGHGDILSMPLLAFVAHPLGGGDDRAANLLRACRWFVWTATVLGLDPVAPWIPVSMIWTEERREEGLSINRGLLGHCDLLLLCGGRVSPGMAQEKAWAEDLGLRVVDLTFLGPEPPSIE